MKAQKTSQLQIERLAWALIQFETKVIHEIEILDECTTSDAQGALMINEDKLHEGFRNEWTAVQTANYICNNVKPSI